MIQSILKAGEENSMANMNKGSFIAERAKKTSERSLTSQELDFFGGDNIQFPRNALVGLTSNCNHACVFCANPRMKRKSGKLDVDFFKKFVDDAVALGLEEIGFYTTGEPLVSKNLLDFIKIAKDAGINYIYITTNGALAGIERMKTLLDAGLNSVKFSINAGSKEAYNLIHGRDDFDVVVENLSALRKHIDENKRDVKVLSSFVVTRQTMHEIEEYKNIIGPLVDDYLILGVKGQSGQSLQQLKELNCEMTPSYPEEGQASPCSMLWNRLHLTQEGYLTLCCVDYENDLTYADLSKTTLEEAWNNSVIGKMRKRHVEQKLQGTLCYNCLYGKEEKFEPLLDTKKVHRSEKLFKKGNLNVKNRIEMLNKTLKKEK